MPNVQRNVVTATEVANVVACAKCVADAITTSDSTWLVPSYVQPGSDIIQCLQ